MPWGSWINELPTEFFPVVQLGAFAAGAGFASAAAGAWRAAPPRVVLEDDTASSTGPTTERRLPRTMAIPR
jgi:hypothetical protein